MSKKRGASIIILIAVVIFVLISSSYLMRLMTPETRQYSYSEILYMFEDQQVSGYELDLGSNEVVLKMADGSPDVVYRVAAPSYFLDSIEPYVQEYNEDHPDDRMEFNWIQATDNTWLWSLVPYLLMIAAMGVLWYFMFKQTSGGGKMNQFGKANLVKTDGKNGKKTTFADVAGADEEKEELREIVDFLKHPKKFNDLGARIPKGVLLLGPPGTGKTLLARSVAGEAGVPFFSISGSDFVEMFVGVGASRVRDLFDQAKKNAPAIIFIDEIDAAGLGGGHDEREQTLNQLLVEMDGFSNNEGIVVIAATNRRDILDPALLRPGRFDRQIVVNYPDVKGREEILKVHSRNKPLGFDVDLGVIAKTTAGFTGADLENLMNEAALLAARKGHKAITNEDIEEATIKVVAGPEKRSKVISDKERRITAYHEAGHAITTYYCPTQDPVHEISIIPRGMAGGYTMSLPEHDKSYVGKKEMEENLVTLLGGRIAESIILEDISTGASNDIERASKIARSMVTRYGFSEKLGPIVYGQDDGEIFLGKDLGTTRNYSEEVAAEIDGEVRRIIGTAYNECKRILTEHIDQLHIVAQYLIKHEKVSGEVFQKLMRGELLDDTTSAPKKSPAPVEPKPGETIFEAAERAAENAGPAAAPEALPQAGGEAKPAENPGNGEAPAEGSPENKTE